VQDNAPPEGGPNVALGAFVRIGCIDSEGRIRLDPATMWSASMIVWTLELCRRQERNSKADHNAPAMAALATRPAGAGANPRWAVFAAPVGMVSMQPWIESVGPASIESVRVIQHLTAGVTRRTLPRACRAGGERGSLGGARNLRR